VRRSYQLLVKKSEKVLIGRLKKLAERFGSGDFEEFRFEIWRFSRLRSIYTSR
jgi:hypothetical protein